MEKILISGTGRCGTTFLIKLFTFLRFNTGFTRSNYRGFIFKNCNSGMEDILFCEHSVVKNPEFLCDVEAILDSKIPIKCMIIPVRNYKDSARSRVSHGEKPGGLWHATNEKEQLEFYHKIMANYVYYMTKYDIKTIFLDFDRMITNPEYLFEKLQTFMDEKGIDLETFKKEYAEASRTSSQITGIDFGK